MSRSGKKTLYGGLYLVLFGIICLGIYSVLKDENGNICLFGCPINAEIIYEIPIVLPLPEPTSIIITRIKNSSSDYGLEGFAYTLRIFSKFGPELLKLSGRANLYPQEEKYLVQSPVNLRADEIGVIEFIPGELDWQANLSKTAEISFANISFGTEENFRVTSGEVAVSEKINTLSILALGYDSLGNIYRASEVKLNGLRAGEIRPFKIYLPELEYSKVELLSDILPD